jgi:predicted  nucleic acid-binding Zn-ribbon protein
MATFLGAINSEKNEITSLNKRLISLNKQFNQVQRKYYKTESIIDERKLDDLSSKMAKVSSRLEYLESK